jgi:predicted phage baseplate assembly protein
MPLIPPALDDRSYDDLVQDLLANIPAHTPEWTNPQPGDPGRTLLELFAWLADTILYRANLIPEKQRIAFLRLLGQSMQPAAAATGLLSLSLGPSATAPVGIVAPAQVSGPVNFETRNEIDLLPLTGQAYIKVPLSKAQQASSLALRTGLMTLYTLGSIPTGYTTTPLFSGGQYDANGFDILNDTTDQSIWLALLASSAQTQPAALAALTSQPGQLTINVGFVPLMAVPGLYSVPQGYTGAGTPATVNATWTMTLQGLPYQYTLMKVMGDTTQGLTQPGIVQLQIPTGPIGAPPNNVLCDVQAGVGMKPPRIDDPTIASRLVTWIRLATQSAFSVSWLGANAVQIDQRTTYSSIVIGVSDGSISQQFALPQTQVDPATFVLQVDMPGLGFQNWSQVDDLAILQGPAQAYALDPEGGTVTFGNQLQGMIPPAGRRILVQTMRAGGGSAGNLQPGTLTAIQAFDASGNQVTQTITVQQPIPTTGGADPETLQSAQQRIPSLLQNQSRAVTASDYQNLASQTPGANVARVEVLPLFMPQTKTPNVPGVVSVMVIPNKSGVMYPNPRADMPTLQTVYQYLNPCRPVTAEMYVIASEYVQLGISVAVEFKSGYQSLQVAQAVETALRSYLWPIAPGGMNQTGWPLGRTVRQLELEVVVSQVAGVTEVNGLNLFSVLASGAYQLVGADSSGSPEITLSSWQLPELLQVIVITNPDGTTGTASTVLTPPPENDSTVAVPVVSNVC